MGGGGGGGGGGEKETVRKVDHNCHLIRCHEKAREIARVEEEVGWRKLWDELLSYKLCHVEGLKALSQLMSHHRRGSKPCPCCEENSMTVSVLDHVLMKHCVQIGLSTSCDRDWVTERY